MNEIQVIADDTNAFYYEKLYNLLNQERFIK
jgi:hypothetical protein